MNDLENRLRRDLVAMARFVGPDSVRPLRPPTGSVPGGRPIRRRFAPAAALLAIAAVIAAVSLVAGRKEGPGHSPLATRPSATAGMPRFYVTVPQSYTANGKQIVTRAVVHSSATGTALATVTVPTLWSQGGARGAAITAAGDDRTFVLSETGGSGPDHHTTRFYLLRVSRDGRSATLRRLNIAIPESLATGYVALSPDGTRLAMQEQSCYRGGCYYTGIRVVTIATKAVRVWTTRASGAPFNISWAGNDTVAFLWGRHYRLLNVTGTGGNLLAGPAIAAPAAGPTGYMPMALVTSDGRTVITSAVLNVPGTSGHDTVVARIVELSARTGKLLKVLSTTTVRKVPAGYSAGGTADLDQSCNVLALAPSGTNVLASCFSLGRVDGSGFVRLPGFPPASRSGIGGQQAAAW